MSTMSVVEQNPVGTQNTNEDVAFTHRKKCFEELGFTDLEAELLAEAKTVSWTTDEKTQKKLRWETPLYHGNVAKALTKGMTLEQAFRIFRD